MQCVRKAGEKCYIWICNMATVQIYILLIPWDRLSKLISIQILLYINNGWQYKLRLTHHVSWLPMDMTECECLFFLICYFRYSMGFIWLIAFSPPKHPILHFQPQQKTTFFFYVTFIPQPHFRIFNPIGNKNPSVSQCQHRGFFFVLCIWICSVALCRLFNIDFFL